MARANARHDWAMREPPRVVQNPLATCNRPLEKAGRVAPVEGDASPMAREVAGHGAALSQVSAAPILLGLARHGGRGRVLDLESKPYEISPPASA